MNRAQFQKLSGKAAAARQELFGVNAAGDTQLARLGESDPFACYFTPVRTQEQLDDLGFKDVHDTIVRFSRSVPITPREGSLITLAGARPDGTDLVVRISEFGMSPANTEWVLGCKARF